MATLHSDLIGLIVSLLPPRHRLSMRLVCHHWRDSVVPELIYLPSPRPRSVEELQSCLSTFPQTRGLVIDADDWDCDLWNGLEGRFRERIDLLCVRMVHGE